jgi:hypothetical protein
MPRTGCISSLGGTIKAQRPAEASSTRSSTPGANDIRTADVPGSSLEHHGTTALRVQTAGGGEIGSRGIQVDEDLPPYLTRLQEARSQ